MHNSLILIGTFAKRPFITSSFINNVHDISIRSLRYIVAAYKYFYKGYKCLLFD